MNITALLAVFNALGELLLARDAQIVELQRLVAELEAKQNRAPEES